MSGYPDQLRPRPRPQQQQKEPRPGDGRNGGVPPSGASRAERFEAEKQRIIQSCFSKKDADGSALESYITHIRIIEDAAYPSSPPPPKSPQENKKPRSIIVAVRKSGRVRMHKARENNDGSFSIGKTWLMDDLSRIQTYEHLPASNPSEQQQKAWASNVGFAVTVTKPYYWQAATPKERDFFIGSLVKIYKKYTGGKIPDLLGFDPRDRDALISTTTSGTQPPQPPRTHGPSPARPDTSLGRSRSPSRQPQAQASQSPYSNRAASRDGPSEARRQPSREQFLRTQASRDQMNRRPHSPSPRPSKSSLSRDDAPSKGADSLDSSEPTPPSSLRSDPAHRKRVGAPMQDTPTNRQTQQSSDARVDAHEGYFPKQPTQDDTSHKDEGPDTQDSSSSIPPLEVTKTKSPLADMGDRPPTGKLPLPPGASTSTPGQGQLHSESNENFVTPYSSPGRPYLEEPPPSRGSNKSIGSPEKAFTGRSEDAIHPPDSKTVDRNLAESPTDPSIELPKPLDESKVPEVNTETAPLQTKPTLSEPIPPTPTASAEEKEKENENEKGEDVHRPGLGPMVKNKAVKDLASTFRKAATAYNAFKPRPGGGAERFMAATREKDGNEPDGITGVVPAPLSRGVTDDSGKTVDENTKDVTASRQGSNQDIPKVSISEASSQALDGQVASDTATLESQPKSPSPSGERRRQRREVNMTKYCAALGIDPSLLQGRGAYFDDILTDLGWDGKLDGEKRIEDLEADVRREIGRVQASSWLGHLEHQEGKVDQLARLIDKTIAECEELDGLLTLYSHELNTLADDVAYIEAQSQGLQVQAANQKLLQNELQGLLKTISISSSDLRPLREASLSNPDGIHETESTLSTLYKAMVTIDPDIRQNQKRLADSASDRGGIGVYADTQIGQMRAVKERKGEYRKEAQEFLQRLTQYMGLAFKMAEQKARDSVSKSREAESSKSDPGVHERIRQELWMYNPLMLFAREVSADDWTAIITLYEQQMKQTYQNRFREIQMTWKREARKATGDEHELLFTTSQDKDREGEGLSTAARKLTVRRGKTVRAPGGLSAKSSRRADGKIEPYVAFAETLDETAKLVCEEQNFSTRYFHLSSQTSADFSELVSAALPEERRCPDVQGIGSYEPDREVAKQLEQAIENIFSSWIGDMQGLADWTLHSDPLQGVGAIYALEKKLGVFEETNQEFLVRGLHKVHSRLMTLFTRFVDEQIRAIEDTKVKVKKRKGVISFMRTFPNFSMTVENMLSISSGEVFNIRFSVNEAYTKINRAMWDSLKFIAKEAPGQQATPSAGAGDPEDKEVLNYHILLIENMNHYVEEVDVRENIVLEEWKDRAARDMNEHLRFYMDSVIRRPLGKLLDFVESTESLLQTTTSAPTEIALRPSHSRIFAKKLLSAYDSRELRRGIDALKKRVEKHFGEADEVALSRNLVGKVLKECEARYSNIHDRTRRILEDVYEGQIDLEWRKEEASAMFKR